MFKKLSFGKPGKKKGSLAAKKGGPNWGTRIKGSMSRIGKR